MSRFTDELTEREAATIMIGLTLLMLDSTTGAVSGHPVPPARLREILDDVEAIFADVGERLDVPALDPDLIAHTRWRLDNLAEGESGEAFGAEALPGPEAHGLSDRELVERFPWMPWLEPVKIIYVGDGKTHYGCRLCIARKGLRGPDVAALPLDPQPILDHLREAHDA